MGQVVPHIYNSTQETVKICLMDTENKPTDAIILAGEIWSRETKYGCNTIIIIPLNSNQNTFSYTLHYNMGLIIKRKLGKLVLIESKQSRQLERDVTLKGHDCGKPQPSPPFYYQSNECCKTGCIVFNESDEPIRICVTDFNGRNTHVILDHGEHNIVETIGTTSSAKKLFLYPSHYAPEILVSVLDFDRLNQEQDLIAKAKYSITSYMHQVVAGGHRFIFLRVIKKDGYFTIEQDALQFDKLWNSADAPYNYLLSKEFSQKVQSLGAPLKTIKTPEGKYDVVHQQDENCCIL
ncbi:unnamed protein product [Rotaria sp. Silwood2]|nr:unnamed protein product [Rotaria sp. Silwood2]